MTIVRKLFYVVIAAALAAFALPASAQQKIYSINVSPLGISPVAVTIKNETPNGNSTINSFIIKPPTGVSVTIASPASSAAATVTKDPGTGWVYVNGFAGLKAALNNPYQITIYLNATYPNPTPQCGDSYTWTAKVYTGNAFSQTEFSQVTPVGTTPTQSVPSCKYSVNVTPGSLTAGTSTTLTVPPLKATIKNESAAGAPSITSASLTPPGGLSAKSASATTGTATVTAGVVNVSGLNLGPGQSVDVSVAVDTACVPSSASWGPTASGTAGAFTLLAAASSFGTSVVGTCTLQFLTQPQSASVNVSFDVKLQALDGSGSPIGTFGCFTDPPANTMPTVTYSLVPASSGNPVVGACTAAGGVITQSLKIGNSGQFQLKAASALGNANQTVTTNPPGFFVYAGQVDCGQSLGDISDTGGVAVNAGTGLDANGLPVPGWAAGSRGVNDKGGPCTAKVDATFTNNILSGNNVNFTWAVNQVPGAAFRYSVNWKPEYVDSSTGMPSQHTYVRWFGLNDPGAPVLGRACIAQSQNPTTKDFLPVQYGALASDDTLSTTISVTASIAIPTAPFAITIGSERLIVTAVAGTSWTVVRGDGSTPTPTTGKSAGTPVMSNPLPVYYPNGISQPSVQMGMCIADEGFTIVPPGANDCPTSTTSNPSVTPPTKPTACAAVTTTLYDIGDGLGVRSP